MDYRKTNRIMKRLAIALIFVSLVQIGLTIAKIMIDENHKSQPTVEVKQHENSCDEIPLETAELSDFIEFDLNLENVEKHLEIYHIEHPDIVLAQIRLESGNLTSNLVKENSNLLGMKYPYQRPTTAIGERNGFAEYENWKDCLQDYAIWQSRYCKKLTDEEYFKYLEDNYASNPVYVQKLKELINER